MQFANTAYTFEDEFSIAKALLKKASYSNMKLVVYDNNVKNASVFTSLNDDFIPIVDHSYFDYVQRVFSGATGMTRWSEKQQIKLIVNGLYSVSTTKKIFSHFENDCLRIWLVTDHTDIKTKRKYCQQFASLVNSYLDPECSFDIRIIRPESQELKRLPSGTQAM